MLKDYLQKNAISIYKAAKDLNIPYSTLNDIANNRKTLDKCEYGLVKRIASYLNISLQELEDVCNTTKYIHSTKFHIYGELIVKSKHYHIIFPYNNTIYDIKLCRVTSDILPFLEEMALYEMNKHIKIMQMEEILCNIY